MSKSAKLNPINKINRIVFLDILRGIAILFIFTANLPFFSGMWFLSSEENEKLLSLPIDDYVDFIAYTLIDGKFYSIFSLLFGIGFVVQYNNRGTMATIGRYRAVVDLSFIKFAGIFAWFVWMFLHLMLLIDFRNRLIVFANWSWSFFNYDRGIRLIIRDVKRK